MYRIINCYEYNFIINKLLCTFKLRRNATCVKTDWKTMCTVFVLAEEIVESLLTPLEARRCLNAHF